MALRRVCIKVEVIPNAKRIERTILYAISVPPDDWTKVWVRGVAQIQGAVVISEDDISEDAGLVFHK